MTTTNTTEDGGGNQKSYEQQFCSPELTGGIHNQLIFLSVLNSFLSITAFLGNTLILVALHKSSLHPPTKLLLRSLAATDLCVGIIAEPLIVAYWMSVVNERWNICRYAQASVFITGHMMCSVSLLTLTVISVERLLALLLELRYRQVVTLKRTYVTVISLWFVSIVFPAMYFWKYHITLWSGFIGAPMCLVISTFSYAKIFLTLRQLNTRVQTTVLQGQRSQTIPINMARYKKAVSTALWLQLTLVVCYLPYGMVGVFMTQRELSSAVYLARQFALTLVLFNSSLNPILYCWKIREVRQSVKDTVSNFLCLAS